jgi:hypothetical protein
VLIDILSPRLLVLACIKEEGTDSNSKVSYHNIIMNELKYVREEHQRVMNEHRFF